jgi:hypothetical protein
LKWVGEIVFGLSAIQKLATNGVTGNEQGSEWIVGTWELNFCFARDPGVSEIDSHKPTYQEFEFSRGGYLKYLNHALVSVVLPGAGTKFPMQMILSFRPVALMCAALAECSFWTEQSII